jgi:hypothetical protein
MKKIIAILAIMSCIVGTASTVFARGGHHGGRYHGGYHHRSHIHSYHHGGHHHNDLSLTVGIAGGLLLGSALIHSLEPPPSRICVEEQTVTGEWQISRYDGRQVWVQYRYPVVRRYQVPCF